MTHRLAGEERREAECDGWRLSFEGVTRLVEDGIGQAAEGFLLGRIEEPDVGDAEVQVVLNALTHFG